MVPFFEGAQYAGADHENFAEGEGAQWVVAGPRTATPCASPM